MPPKIINFIKEFYSESNCQDMHRQLLSQPSATRSVMRPDHVMAPLLFLIIIDNSVRVTIQNKGRGLTWKLIETLEDLDYAVDVCLLAHTFKDMQANCAALQEEFVKASLQINLGKTKEMRDNDKGDHY